MRKYLLPALVCAAIGALLLLVLERDSTTKPGHEPVKTAAVTPATPKNLIGEPAQTPTRLDEHKWLREFERALAENKLDRAMYFRQKVCEDMDTILASEKLTKDLLDAIRKYGIESDDLARRDVTLPILRILEHPEATKMIANEYYRAKNEGEQMTLLEAMSKPFHDPKQASVWAVDKALNSESAEARERAFDIMKTYVLDEDLLGETAMQIYNGSMDDRQRAIAVKTACERGRGSALCREFVRRVLRNPQGEDVMSILPALANWGDENDAARLDQLATEYPAMAEVLHDQARMVRRARRDEANPGSGHEEEMEFRRKMDEERRQREAAEEKGDG